MFLALLVVHPKYVALVPGVLERSVIGSLFPQIQTTLL